MDAIALSHSSAVCLIPPRSCWEQLQEIRCFKDKAFVRWPPHINLLYPFLDDSGTNFEEASRRARNSVAAVEPFEVCCRQRPLPNACRSLMQGSMRTKCSVYGRQVTLKTFEHFVHGRSCTLWLDPESSGVRKVPSIYKQCFFQRRDCRVAHDSRDGPGRTVGCFRRRAAAASGGVAGRLSAVRRPQR